ncbi:MAG: dihydroneopterin aldolase [Oscillospiraceae bacterium]|jgi:dihydroneopterin aldolase|nr:dihydroneopterin aldolase [Oscillospiraceae bacterium]
MERITIRGLELYAKHGVNPEEKRDGQVFFLDITVWFHATEAMQSDDLDATVNYASVIKVATHYFLDQIFDLIERAAYVTAQAIMDAFPLIESLELTVHKPGAPIKASVQDIAFTMTLNRR